MPTVGIARSHSQPGFSLEGLVRFVTVALGNSNAEVGLHWPCVLSCSPHAAPALMLPRNVLTLCHMLSSEPAAPPPVSIRCSNFAAAGRPWCNATCAGQSRGAARGGAGSDFGGSRAGAGLVAAHAEPEVAAAADGGHKCAPSASLRCWAKVMASAGQWAPARLAVKRMRFQANSSTITRNTACWSVTLVVGSALLKLDKGLTIAFLVLQAEPPRSLQQRRCSRLHLLRHRRHLRALMQPCCPPGHVNPALLQLQGTPRRRVTQAARILRWLRSLSQAAVTLHQRR